jgi:hypothetical protein
MAESGKPAGSAMRFSVAGGTWAIAVHESANSYFALRPDIACSSSQFTSHCFVHHYFERSAAGGMLMLELNETDGFLQ